MMENNAFITVAHPVGPLVSVVVLEYLCVCLCTNLFRNMKVHILVTRSEALGETKDNPLMRALKWAIGDADLGLA